MATAYKRKADKRNPNKAYRVRWFDAERGKWRDTIGVGTKSDSEALGRKWELEAKRRAEGLTTATDDHRRQPIGEHVDAFVESIENAGRSDLYVFQVRARIERVVAGVKAKVLGDLDPVLIERFLAGLRKPKGDRHSGATRNEYVGNLRSFTKWAVETQRIESDPLVRLKRTERRAMTLKHKRRALSLDDLARLLIAAEERPLIELETIRRGPNAGRRLANVKPHNAAKALQKGRERRLAYLLAAWCGLRRSELAALTWGDIDLDVKPPRIRLRAETTKSKRADVLALHPQLADALRAARPTHAKADQCVVSVVPSMKALSADLKYAGIEYGDERTGYVDLHALRTTLSTMMAAAGMSQRARQAHMRHTDPRLTEGTYMDEALLPVASELAALPAIPDRPHDDADAQPIPLRATGTDNGRAANAQQMAQQSTGLNEIDRDETGPNPALGWADEDLADTDRNVRNSRQASEIEIERDTSRRRETGRRSKAGEGIRTLDIHVGNVTLYH